jgi:hypothetical protein
LPCGSQDGETAKREKRRREGEQRRGEGKGGGRKGEGKEREEARVKVTLREGILQLANFK